MKRAKVAKGQATVVGHAGHIPAMDTGHLDTISTRHHSPMGWVREPVAQDRSIVAKNDDLLANGEEIVAP